MKQMKRSLALLLVLLVLLQAFAVCIGAAVSTPSFKNTGRRHVAATALSTSALTYYQNHPYTTLAAQGASTLLSTLRTLMTSTHTSTSTYENCRDLAMYTDTDNTGKISLLYTSYNTDYENGYINKVSNGWNREHVWPQSIGGFGTSGAGADLHHIRPSDSSINSKRGNDKYGEVNGGTAVSGTGPSSGVLGGYSSGSYFEPLDNVKGDVARICLYIYVRYGSELSGCSSVTNAFQSVDVLLEWCEMDPVDEWEMGRNDVIESVQGNRNVFIDYPEYAWLIFGEEVPENLATPTGSSGVTPPPSSGGGSTTPSTPSTPTTPVYNKVTSLKTGDEIIITAPAYNKALSMQKVSTHYNKGVNYTETDFSGITNDEIFVVTANADDTYTFTSKSGKVLAMSTEYNSLNDAGTNKTWSMEQKSGTDDVFYLKNVGRGTYLEWYASKDNWSTYTPNSLSDLFELSFYLVPPPHEHQFVNGSCECGATDPNYVPPSTPSNPSNPSNPGGSNTDTDVNQGGSNAPTTGGDQDTSTLPQEKDNTVLIVIIIAVCVVVLGGSTVAFVIVYKKTKNKAQ